MFRQGPRIVSLDRTYVLRTEQESDLASEGMGYYVPSEKYTDDMDISSVPNI